MKRIAHNKLSHKEVVQRLISIWGKKYDYSLVKEENYVDTSHNIPIICNKHNKVFYQTPKNHMNGHGCPLCANEKRKLPNFKKRGLLFGIGVFDSKQSRTAKNLFEKAYKAWQNMLARCTTRKDAAYNGCEVFDEWKIYSNFERWFLDPENGYKDGYAVDKDILVKNNRIYSPDTCLIVPSFINKLFVKQKKRKSNLPIGVHKSGKSRFVAILAKNRSIFRLGTFSTSEEAFNAYKEAKEAYIKEVAQEYYDAGKITKRVYDALMNYKVEITD